jgi:DNA (cytosine-5)-methyltransferase 1
VVYLASGSEKVGVLMANAGTKLWLGNQEAFSGNYHIIEKTPLKHVVRRLTPLECCRLQGFPDWWEEGVDGGDGARYKMWGNGMALPNMLHVMRGIVEMEKRKEPVK